MTPEQAADLIAQVRRTADALDEILKILQKQADEKR